MVSMHWFWQSSDAKRSSLVSMTQRQQPPLQIQLPAPPKQNSEPRQSVVSVPVHWSRQSSDAKRSFKFTSSLVSSSLKLNSEESSDTAYEPLTINNAAITVNERSFMIDMFMIVASMMIFRWVIVIR